MQDFIIYRTYATLLSLDCMILMQFLDNYMYLQTCNGYQSGYKDIKFYLTTIPA